jgi:DNA adenine methylase
MSVLEEVIPVEMNRYIEPFLGGGSVLLWVLSNAHSNKIEVNDMEPNLIACWKTVKSKPNELINLLEELNELRDLKSFKYLITIYNDTKLSNVERSALLIYFTKLAFNASLRWTNGKINPKWSEHHSNVNIFNNELITSISKALKKVSFNNDDYVSFLKKVQPKKGDFVFLDPPYLVSNVGDYYESVFNFQDYQKLRKICDSLNKNQVNFVVTTNDDPSLRKLFKGYNIQKLIKSSTLRLHAEKNVSNNELIIYN